MEKDIDIPERRRRLLESFDREGQRFLTKDENYFEGIKERESEQYKTRGWEGLSGRRYSDDQGSASNHAGKGPKGWKRSDESIKEEICEALYNDEYVDASDIDINVTEGFVYLRGSVDSLNTKRAVEDSIESISGIEGIQNELRAGRKLDGKS